MASSLIGALKVSLGLDSAQFEHGLDKARSSLGRFDKLSKVSFAAVGVAAAGAAAGLGVLVLRAANSADALSKTAQKIGVATEALSRLKYAADFSDVSLEQLSGGLGRLSKNMLDVASGAKGPASTAFAALGVTITDTAGKLRDPAAVFTDIADKLSRIEDGALKTALAQRLFGKSGADLIPLLNEGAAGLKRFADESDRTGNTITTKTGKSAERFNDTMALVDKRLEGVANQIMEASLPALQAFADVLTSPQFGQGAADLAILIINAMKDIIPFIQNAIGNMTALRDLFVDINNMSIKGLQNKVTDLKNDVTTRENRIADLKGRLASGNDLFGINRGAMEAQIASDVAAIQPLIDKISEVQAVIAGREFVPTETSTGAGATGTSTAAGLAVDMDALGASTTKTKNVFGDFLEKVEAGQAVFDTTRTQFEQLAIDLGNLQQKQMEGTISWDTYGRAASQAVAGAAASVLGSLGSMSAGLSQAFEDNKTLAIATAVLKGAESVASSFAAGSAIGGPFVGAAFAGVAAITAAANVAAVAATSQTSSSMSGSAPSVSAPAEAPAAQSSGPSIYLELQGSRFSRADVEGLIKDLNSAIKDGAKLQVA